MCAFSYSFQFLCSEILSSEGAQRDAESRQRIREDHADFVGDGDSGDRSVSEVIYGDLENDRPERDDGEVESHRDGLLQETGIHGVVGNPVRAFQVEDGEMP